MRGRAAGRRSRKLTFEVSDVSSDATSRRTASSSPSPRPETRRAPRRPFHRGLKQRLHARPSLGRHGPTSEPSSRLSHAFAVRQSRLAVEGDTLSTCAASLRESAKRTKLDELPVQSQSFPGDRARDPTRGLVSRLTRLRLLPGRLTRSAHRRPVCSRRDDEVIDQDAAHDLRRDTKEMRSILPIDLALVDEPHVHS